MRASDHKKIKGFTLVEMMVAVFVFSVVMVLATGAIFSIVNAYKTSQALKSALDNLSSALDTISRSARYGYNFHCGSNVNSSNNPSCSEGGIDDQTFAFVDRNNIKTVYSLIIDDSNARTGYIGQCIIVNGGDCSDVSTNADNDYIRLTAPEVRIKYMHFYVQGASSGENTQPEMLMTIAGYANSGNASSTFNIETMIDQRNPMCKDSMSNLCQ